MKIYLMSAIDKVVDVGTFVESITKFLSEFHDQVSIHQNDIWKDYSIFLPQIAYQGKYPNWGKAEEFIVDMNRYALHKADCAIVLYQPGIESWGVPIEIYIAYNKKPIFLHIMEKPAFPLPMYLSHFTKEEHISFDIEGLIINMMVTFGDQDE